MGIISILLVLKPNLFISFIVLALKTIFIFEREARILIAKTSFRKTLLCGRRLWIVQTILYPKNLVINKKLIKWRKIIKLNGQLLNIFISVGIVKSYNQ